MNTENNKLIAEFMEGYEPEEYEDFHSDWNWLMEVVEKIESLDYRFAITEFLSEVSNEKLSIKSWKEKTKFENTYNACVEFIKWYNQQK